MWHFFSLGLQDLHYLPWSQLLNSPYSIFHAGLILGATKHKGQVGWAWDIQMVDFRSTIKVDGFGGSICRTFVLVKEPDTQFTHLLYTDFGKSLFDVSVPGHQSHKSSLALKLAIWNQANPYRVAAWSSRSASCSFLSLMSHDVN